MTSTRPPLLLAATAMAVPAMLVAAPVHSAQSASSHRVTAVAWADDAPLVEGAVVTLRVYEPRS